MEAKDRHQKVHKGHPEANAASKGRKNKATLQDLPVELLELICHFLMEEPRPPFTHWMLDFRLACRSLNQKTYDLFARAAFRECMAYIDLNGLGRLNGIAKTPRLAGKIQCLRLLAFENTLWFPTDYHLARRNIKSPNLSQQERQSAEQCMRQVHEQQAESNFLERSGGDSILLMMALQRLPNLQDVMIACVEFEHGGTSVRRQDYGNGESTTHAFSLLCACLPFTEVRLRKLEIGYGGSFRFNHDAVSVQALSMPTGVMECFQDLQELTLLLQTKDGHYRNPYEWHEYLAGFLLQCSQLRKLDLSFLNDWDDTEILFRKTANEVVLPRLKDLTLNFLRCKGEHLNMFLSNHQDLESLNLHNLDVTGDVPFEDTLGLLHHRHDQLSSFSCSQIAQNSRRLYFETYGDISDTVMGGSRRPEEIELAFFDDCVQVSVSKYCGSAETWEGVQYKISILREDLRISDLTYHPDIAVGWPMWTI